MITWKNYVKWFLAEGVNDNRARVCLWLLTQHKCSLNIKRKMLNSTFSTLGSAEAARGTAEARNRGVPGNGCQVHGEAQQAAIADVANVPGEPREAVGVGGLFCGADGEFPNPVCLSRSVS